MTNRLNTTPLVSELPKGDDDDFKRGVLLAKKGTNLLV